MQSNLHCAACHCNLSSGYYLQDEALYCDNCWSCADCARPTRGGGRCAECAEPQQNVVPRVLDFLRELGLEPPAQLHYEVVGAVGAGHLARELTHAWQSDLPPALRKGLARWVQHRLLLALGYPELANRLLIDDKGPLRLCLQLQDSVGESEVIRALKGCAARDLRKRS